VLKKGITGGKKKPQQTENRLIMGGRASAITKQTQDQKLGKKELEKRKGTRNRKDLVGTLKTKQKKKSGVLKMRPSGGHRKGEIKNRDRPKKNRGKKESHRTNYEIHWICPGSM